MEDTIFEPTMIFQDHNRTSQRKQLERFEIDVWKVPEVYEDTRGLSLMFVFIKSCLCFEDKWFKNVNATGV